MRIRDSATGSPTTRRRRHLEQAGGTGTWGIVQVDRDVDAEVPALWRGGVARPAAAAAAAAAARSGSREDRGVETGRPDPRLAANLADSAADVFHAGQSWGGAPALPGAGTGHRTQEKAARAEVGRPAVRVFPAESVLAERHHSQQARGPGCLPHRIHRRLLPVRYWPGRLPEPER